MMKILMCKKHVSREGWRASGYLAVFSETAPQVLHDSRLVEGLPVDQISAGDPDTKLLLPGVGPVKTNLVIGLKISIPCIFDFRWKFLIFLLVSQIADLPKNVGR